MVTVHRFDGGYNRAGVVRMGILTCDVCGTETLCMDIDASEGEYASAYLCYPCVAEWFINWESIQGQDERDRTEATPLGYAQGVEDARKGTEDGDGRRWGTRFSAPPEDKGDNWKEHWRSAQMKGAQDYMKKWYEENPSM